MANNGEVLNLAQNAYFQKLGVNGKNHKQVEQAGGLYVFSTSFEQFYNWYNLKIAGDGK